MLKDDLLYTGYFIDNEYLNLYISLISNNVVEYEKFKTCKHHIIPVTYYKLEQIPINNEKNNLVCLTHYNHILAHYYLIFCTVSELRKKMIFAFNFMISEHNRYKVPNKEDLFKNLINYAQVKEEFCKLVSSTNLGRKSSSESIQKARNTFYNHYGVNSISQLPGVGQKISKSKKGVCTITEEQRKRLSEATSKRLTGVKKSEEFKTKVSQTLMGHTVSEETRRKISLKCKGHIPPNANTICVHHYKTIYLKYEDLEHNGIIFDNLLDYLNKQHFHLGAHINNNKLQNRNFKFYVNSGKVKLRNIKNKFNASRENR